MTLDSPGHLRGLFALYARGVVSRGENAMHLKRIGLWLVIYPFAKFGANMLLQGHSAGADKAWAQMTFFIRSSLASSSSSSPAMEFGREIEQEKDLVHLMAIASAARCHARQARQIRSNELARAIGITESNLSLLKSGKVRGFRFFHPRGDLPPPRMPARRPLGIRAGRDQKHVSRKIRFNLKDHDDGQPGKTRFARRTCAPWAATLLSGCLRLPPVADMGAPVTARRRLSRRRRCPSSSTATVSSSRSLFTRPDGSARKALAFVNQGEGGLDLSNTLFRELDPKPGRPLRLKIGAMEMAVDGYVARPETLANDMAIGLNPFAGAAELADLAAALWAAPWPPSPRRRMSKP